MNKEKQIEEMAEAIFLNCHCGLFEDEAKMIAEFCYQEIDRKASEIFEEIEKALNRKIARSKPQFEKLHRNEKDLSIWGYKDMGYFQGIISTCEDIQGIIAELKKKYTESEKDDG